MIAPDADTLLANIALRSAESTLAEIKQWRARLRSGTSRDRAEAQRRLPELRFQHRMLRETITRLEGTQQ